MTLWIIAAVASGVLLAGVAYLVRKRDAEQDHWKPRHSHPWDERPDDDEAGRLPSLIPPPSGLPIGTSLSEEFDRSGVLESTELWIEDEPTGPIPAFALRAAGESHAGQERTLNEDALLVWPEKGVYVVADGMGGYASGEVASNLAVATIEQVLRQDEIGPLDEGLPTRGAELVAAVRAAHAKIRADALADEQKRGMGTTVVAARFSPGRNRVYIAHVGDSRCYRLREGQLRQLTTDHTLGSIGIQGKAAGKLSRAVGVFDEVEVDLTVDEPRPGDRYLLCSDGLYKMLSEEEILEALGEAEPAAIAGALIARANERGGRDNVTAIAIHVEEPSFESARARNEATIEAVGDAT